MKFFKKKLPVVTVKKNITEFERARLSKHQSWIASVDLYGISGEVELREWFTYNIRSEKVVNLKEIVDLLRAVADSLEKKSTSSDV